jgi:predicted Zn-dependent protease
VKGERAAALAAVLGLVVGCAATLAPPVPELPAWDRLEEPIEVDAREVELRDEAGEGLADLELEQEDVFVTVPALDALLAEALQDVVPPLAEGAPEPRVRVIRSAARNASAMPNGVILVSLGLLAALENEAQLVALLGHELAHVVLRHGLVSDRYAKLTASTVDRMALSRDQEVAADLYALRWMSRAGYDPTQMRRMLGFLEGSSKSVFDPAAAWESHPNLTERKRTLDLRGSRPGKTGRRGEHRYEEGITAVLLTAAELEMKAGRFEPAAAAVDRYLARVPEDGHAWYLRAEIARHERYGGRLSDAVRSGYERAADLGDPDGLRALGFLAREEGAPSAPGSCSGAISKRRPTQSIVA